MQTVSGIRPIKCVFFITNVNKTCPISNPTMVDISGKMAGLGASGMDKRNNSTAAALRSPMCARCRNHGVVVRYESSS